MTQNPSSLDLNSNEFSFLVDLSQHVPLPLDIIKTVLVILSTILLAPFFHCFNRPNSRILFSFIPSIFMLIFLLEEWSLYLLAMSFVSYVSMWMLKRKALMISVIISLTFLLFIHSYRFIFDYKSWKIDCSVIVMYMVTKIIYFGVYSSSNRQKWEFFSFIGYCFYFPTLIIGPTFSFQTYLAFIHKKPQFQNIPVFNISMIKLFFTTLCFLTATAILMPIFTPYWIIQNQTYLSLPTILKFLSLNFIGICYRLKFYSGWGLAQMAVNLSGISWKKEEQNFDGIKTGSAYFEIEANPKHKTEYWNTSVQIWLKDCFYDEIFKKTKSISLATYFTFAISAFWHGIYWTYYLGFFQWSIIIQITKWTYKMSLTLSQKITNSIFVKATVFLIGSSLMNYTGMLIVVLTWDEGIRFYSDMQYLGTFLMLSLLLLTLVVKPKRQKKLNEMK